MILKGRNFYNRSSHPHPEERIGQRTNSALSGTCPGGYEQINGRSRRRESHQRLPIGIDPREKAPYPPPVQTTRAIVIRVTRLTESSLIVHWFTESHGLVRTVAKGAKRSKSPFNGRIDLFFGGEITYSPSRRGDLHTLREVADLQWREGLRKSYTTTLLAAYCCQLLEMAVEPEHPDPPFYDLLRRALDHLEVSQPGLRALHHFESELARLLGISNRRQSAEISLVDTLGKLPLSRNDLLERLSPERDFNSSDDAIDR